MRVWISEKDALYQINLGEAVLFDVRSVMDNKQATIDGFKEMVEGSIPLLDHPYLYASINHHHTLPKVGGRHPLPDLNLLYAKLMQHISVNNAMEKKIIIIDHQNGFNGTRLVFLCKLLGFDSQIIDGGYENLKLFNKVTLDEIVLQALINDQLQQNKLSDSSQNDWNKNYQSEFIAFCDEIQQLIEINNTVALHDQKVVLIDARAYERYIGQVEPIDPVKGHIPTAINIHFTSLFENGYIKSNDALKSIFNPVLGKESIVYCGSGMSATPLFCALLSLGERVKVYAGSYSEWTSENNKVEVGENIE